MPGDTTGPQRQPMAPLRSDFAVSFHSEAQIEPLRDATLRLLERTGNLALVQQSLGHRNISTTTIYAHVPSEALQQAMETI